jgi:hypothetical protein
MAGTVTAKAKTKKKVTTTTVTVGPLSSSLLSDVTSAPKGVIADIVGVALRAGKKAGLSGTQTKELEQISLAQSAIETGGTFKPATFIADDVNGPSVGLFQLHSLAVAAGSKATGGELADVPGKNIATQIKNAKNPVTNATIAISHLAAVLKANPNESGGQIAATAGGPANPAAYIADINAEISSGFGGGVGINITSPESTTVVVPKNLSATNLADSGTNTSGTGISSGTASSSGIMAKIGGFLIAAMLIGIGLIILFHSNVEQGAKKMTTAAIA